MNPVEALAAVLGLINIALLVRRSVWNFPFAMAMVTATAFVLFRARLYGETGLQAFFFVVNGWGWWLWSRAKGAEDDSVPVGWMSARQRIAWAGVTAALSLSLGWAMHRFTNAALPFADSAVTGASIAAQFLLSYRRIENWVLWIAIDVVSIALYLARGLPLLAALYGAFLVMSAVGLRAWIGAARRPAGNEVFA
ncbi:nicotinamide riboside transporter PnuC [Novosphingobium sp. EMRT-2]|uniref:nicotinamide riboside transporter PnuC n=1 Tax=Novosphingobium sp. EMRT-2 TaxID=2571749 RepID=UPI0010BD8B88|nr:nicotinamide riboside transporter PnuC [Novosphingobium sp. EMRT-2]QCI93754.1 nicotinamide mononucleotide transporter [Novosphingobium sp. EMRT-2]